MLKLFLASLLAVILIDAPAIALTPMTDHEQRHRPVTYQQLYGVTPEGWWIIFTDEQRFVATMCNEPLNTHIVGCAHWPDPPAGIPETFPQTHCIMGIFTEHPTETIDAIVDHELRHCREGHFHPE